MPAEHRRLSILFQKFIRVLLIYKSDDFNLFKVIYSPLKYSSKKMPIKPVLGKRISEEKVQQQLQQQ